MAAIFVAAIVPNNLLNAKSMIRYKKYKSNQTGVTKNKWYGRAVTELMEFEEFVKHMANHHCVFGESTIRGVLIEMQICMRELLLEGKRFRAADLYKDAKFREAGKYDGGGDDGGETAGTHDEGGNTNGGNSSGDGDTSGGNMSDGGSTDDSANVDL